MEWWSNGVMKGPIQGRFGLSFFPTLQYSSTPKELAPVPAKPLNFDLALRTRFSMLNKVLCFWERGLWLLLTISRIIW
jgi:hypothetical protein